MHRRRRRNVRRRTRRSDITFQGVIVAEPRVARGRRRCLHVNVNGILRCAGPTRCSILHRYWNRRNAKECISAKVKGFIKCQLEFLSVSVDKSIKNKHLTLYWPCVRHVGIGQLRCLTVLPGSWVRKPGSIDTVKFVPVWMETRNTVKVSKPVVVAISGSLPLPDT